MNIEITLKELNGKQIPAVTSLQVAEAFGKRHDHVIRDIREVMAKCTKSFTAPNFGVSEYTDSTGRKLPLYLLSKDGLMMVTMGYTTPEAMRVKEAYIARFNEMDEQLRSASPAIPDFQNPALAARAWAEQYERRQIAEAQRDEAIRHQTTTSPKIAQALKGMLAGVSSGKLRNALCLGYPSIFDAPAPSGYPIDTVSIGYHNRTDTVSIPYPDPINTVGIPPAEEEEEDNSTLTSFECLSESAPLPDAPASEPDEKNPRIDLDRPDPHTRPGEIPCPHKRIIEVYEAILPELPRVRVWRAQQAADLRARWREKLREGKFSDEESGVDYFRRFFGYVRRSEFLMGRRSGRDGRTFRNCLAWMVKAKNFDGIVDGKYHDQEVA